MHLEEIAREAGLDLIGVAPVGESPHWTNYCDWVGHGYAADMAYLTRADAILKRKDPRHILPGTRSVLVVAASYGTGRVQQPRSFEGLLSRYAWGEDYHRWMLKRLKSLVRQISLQAGAPVETRCYVDTGPILERAWAQLAGLGWIGKNACLINPRFGSYIFLGVVLINRDFETSLKKAMPTCGSCSLCIEACPTGALVAPGVLDANRCLSYLTIENRGSIPVELRPMLGNRVFGCDICQDVCPWNTMRAEQHQAQTPYQSTLALREVLELDAEGFRRRFRHSPLWRATPEGLARNAAVVLGNQRGSAVTEYVQRMAETHPSPLVREHLFWAAQQHLKA